MARLSAESEATFFKGVAFAERFFMAKSEVHKALETLVAALEKEAIPYAIVGAMALNEYGYRRVTDDVDVLLTPKGLAAFKAAYLGRGYVERFAGSKGMRDTRHGVAIDVLLTGEYPGDGKPKPICFPDPAVAAVQGERVALLELGALIELKLASGMSAPHRLRDLADVLELIRVSKLDACFADQLDPYVRDRFLELVEAASSGPLGPEEP
jgi:hypothetical protein